jgi:hypothetical protein
MYSISVMENIFCLSSTGNCKSILCLPVHAVNFNLRGEFAGISFLDIWLILLKWGIRKYVTLLEGGGYGIVSPKDLRCLGGYKSVTLLIFRNLSTIFEFGLAFKGCFWKNGLSGGQNYPNKCHGLFE